MGDKMSTELSLIDDPNIPPYRRLYAEDVARVFNCTVPTVTDMKAKGVVPHATYREGKRDVWTVGRISTLNPPTRVNQLQRMPLPGLLTHYLEKTRIIQRSTSKKSMVDSLK